MNFSNYYVLDEAMVTGETQFFDPAYASPEDETAYAQMWIEAYALFSEEGEALAEALGWRGMVGENYFDSPYRYLQATHREWKVVKGEEQPWRLSETEGARLVREGSASDLSDLIVFDNAQARLDDYTARYTVKDGEGNIILDGVLQEELILGPGKYAVEIVLESNRYKTSGAHSYALTLYGEDDFFEFTLRDETRGKTVDGTYLGYAYDPPPALSPSAPGMARDGANTPSTAWS